MGAVERHYLRRNNVIFLQEDEFKPSRKGNDEKVKLPTLSTRYQSSYYITSAQQNKTQVVVKIVSRASGATCVNRLGDYIARDISVEDSKIMGKQGHDIDKNEYLYLEDENGIIYSTKEERRALIKEWSADFRGQQAYKNQEWKDERLAQMKQELSNVQALFVAGKHTEADRNRLEALQKNIKNKEYITKEGKVYDLNVYLPKDTTHMVLSVGGRPKNQRELKKANEAVRSYLNKNLGDLGHRYLFTPHNDTDNLHYHVIIKNCNEFDRKMLRFDKADLFMMRQSFARELERVGFERGAELRKDRELTLERIATGIEQLHQNQTWYQNHLSKGSNKGFDAFMYRSKAIRKTNFLLSALNAEHKHTAFFELKKNANINELKKEVRSFRSALQAVRPKDLEKEKQLLITKLSKDSAFLSTKISQISPYTKESMQNAIAKKTEKSLQAASLFIEAHKERLQQGEKEVRDKHYKSFFMNLQQAANKNQQRIKDITLSKQKTKQKDRGLEFGGFET